jgi:cyclic-di-GMP-binding protein
MTGGEMPQDFSFDVVSKVDLQEVANAVQQASKEIATRFDFRGSASKIELKDKELEIVLVSDDEHKMKSVIDILETKLVRRGVAVKALDYGKIEPAAGGTVRQVARIQQGIPSEKAKEIVKAIKDRKLKVQASIQADQVRVSGRSKDDLQTAMATVREGDFGLPLQFTNYR